MFNKEEYWKNRKNKNRGQGKTIEPKLFKTSDVHIHFTKDNKPMAVPRRIRRRAIKP